MMDTMIPPQVGMRLRMKKKQKRKKEKGQREKRHANSTLVLQSRTMFSNRESPMLSLSYTSGNFHYITWLVCSDDGLPEIPKVLMRTKVGCTPTLFPI